MKPPNHRDDMGLTPEDDAFMAEYGKHIARGHKLLTSPDSVEKTLQTIHVEERLKNALKELRSLIELLGETNRPEAAAYIQTAQDSVAEVLELYFND